MAGESWLGSAIVGLMEPKRAGQSILLAPPYAGSSEACSFPSSSGGAVMRSFPPVDQHIVEPETTRDEMIRGRKIIAQPALEPHGDAHADLGMLLRVHVREGYRASIDLLTRASERSNFATDVSIRREGTDPGTGRRYLEEVSFEIVNEQSMTIVQQKAEDLIERGVRRVFGIFVKRGEVREWSREKAGFVPLDLDGALEDPCFVRPIRVRALLDYAVAEREVVRALEEKRSPELLALEQKSEEKGRQEGLARGLERGLEQERRELLRALLVERFGHVPEAAEGRIAAASGETLMTWVKRSVHAKTLDEVLVESGCSR